ncbi:hypothetical protein FKM82_023531 [Ascaphus truei]
MQEVMEKQQLENKQLRNQGDERRIKNERCKTLHKSDLEPERPSHRDTEDMGSIRSARHVFTSYGNLRTKTARRSLEP